MAIAAATLSSTTTVPDALAIVGGQAWSRASGTDECGLALFRGFLSQFQDSIDLPMNFGVDGTGVDVTFYGDTAGSYILWDYSDDQLEFVNASMTMTETTTVAAPPRMVTWSYTHTGTMTSSVTEFQASNTFNGAASYAGGVTGAEIKARHTTGNAFTIGQLRGLVGNADTKNGTTTVAYAVEGSIDVSAGGTITTSACFHGNLNNSGTVTNSYGAYLEGVSGYNLGTGVYVRYADLGLSIQSCTAGITVGASGSSSDVKFWGGTAGSYLEWDSSADRLNVVVTGRTVTGEEHAVDVSHSATLSSGEAMVGVNVTVSPLGTAGLWASAFYGKVLVAGNALPGTGYCSGAELEVQYNSGITPSDMWILSLNSSNNASMSPGSAFIATHQYGSSDMLRLFNFTDESVAGGATAMVANTATIPAVNDASWVKIRCRCGGTDIWIPATTTAPD